MITTLSERLTAQFYDWERLGRGHIVYDVPVGPEPPFYPFIAHTPGPVGEVADDGRLPSLFSRIGKFFAKPKPEPEPEPDEPFPYPAPVFDCDEEIVTF